VVRQLSGASPNPRAAHRVEREEDHSTRRVARVLGGTIWLLGAALVATSTATVLAWIAVAAIAVMVSLDASVDFCALCFVMAGLDRLGLKLT
jgi:hypothetical protein